MEITQNDIQRIVELVMQNIDTKKLNELAAGEISLAVSEQSDDGIFERMDDAIEAAYIAQKTFIDKFQIKDRKKLVNAIKKTCLEQIEILAKMVYEETGYGRYLDKIEKHRVVIEKTPGPECLTTDALSGDDGLTLEEFAPFGVIGAITPVTNPTETIISNVISMISGGNSVVFNVHPAAKNCCAYCVKLLNQTIVAAGGPLNLTTMVKNPTMDTVGILTRNPKIRLVVGTGGMGMVNSLLRSGKKVIGAGAGNPPVIVDETADISLAARQIFFGASFDNNILCIAEKEVFVIREVADRLIKSLVDEGAYLLNSSELEQIMKLVLEKDEKTGEYHPNKKWVGKDAGLMLESIGITNKKDVKLLICETCHNHPFVLTEQLMPILPIVRCDNLDQAIGYALVAETGNRHTASMFSKDVYNMTKFARAIETTIFVKNSATLAGLGFNGEGSSTMTIAGPTGEGITCAKSFTRKRRCTLAEGGFRVV